MYKNSLVLGKFYPPHSGHLYLINTAIENSEKVHVVLCYNSSQSIPGEIRLKTLTEIYQNNPKVIIYPFNDVGLPQHENECETIDEFYKYWVSVVYKLIDKLDVIFTSENYGDDFAIYLGIKHVLVDKERKNYPISGTEIRNNPFNCWEFIPKEIKPYFIKRVAIMGPESVGKSTLSEKLANYFNTNFVCEYGRTVFENNGNKVEIEDFIPISKGRQSLEDSLIKKSNKIIFCDTEDITTYIFSKMFYPNEYSKIENWFLQKIKPYDIYILLKPDCESIQDGTRCFLYKRQDHYNEIKNELIKNAYNYIEIGGDWDERYNQSIKIIKSEFNI